MIYSKSVTALVPMKAHSERVKEKNLRHFCGKPLYWHILNTLERTYAVDRIFVDTDSEQIAKEAPVLFKKVRIIERPMELRGDFVSMNRIVEHDLSITEADIYIQTHATNPLLKMETIARGLKLFVESEDNDSLFSVTRHQSRFYFSDGRPANHNLEELIRTQDLNPMYEENSSLYVFTKESFNRKKRRIGEKPVLFETPLVESIDIDDEFGFRLAEILSMYLVES